MQTGCEVIKSAYFPRVGPGGDIFSGHGNPTLTAASADQYLTPRDGHYLSCSGEQHTTPAAVVNVLATNHSRTYFMLFVKIVACQFKSF